MSLLDSAAYTSTAEGGAGGADSAQVIYSAAVQASKRLCIAAYAEYDSGLTTAGIWASSPSRIVLATPETPRPGQPTGNRGGQQTGSYATGTTVIPHDNSIPQNTEGDQYMSAAITPTSAANLLAIRAQAVLESSVANYMAMALFQDTGANALKAAVHFQSTAGAEVSLGAKHIILAAAVSATTFKVRCGGGAAGTTYFNGHTAAQIFGGAACSFLEIEEVMG
jgi:hypothetical protein